MADEQRATWTAPSARSSTEYRNRRWWTETSADQAGAAMVSRAREIDRDQSWRRERLLLFAQLYAGRQLTSLYQYGSGRRVPGRPFGEVGNLQVTWNVAQSCVDTLAAQIGKNRVRALFQTIGGDFYQQMRAAKMTSFVDGIFYETGFYDAVADPVFLDASVMDGGVAKVYRHPRTPETIEICRVLPFELLVDEAEAIYGKPRTIYQRQYVPREALLDLYEEQGKGKAGKAEIRAAIETASADDNITNARVSTGVSADRDMVPVYEAWRLPTGDDPGRHMIAIEGRVLYADPKWNKPRFPFAIYRDTPMQAGIWGKGVVEQIVGVQIELNRLLRTIQRGQLLHSVPRWAVQKGTVVDSHVNNEIGAIIHYAGERAPQPFVAPAFAPDVYQWAKELYESSFREVGITALSAAGMKPAGLDAGVAIREYNDIQSTRFVKKGQRWEEWTVDVARLAVAEARDAKAAGKKIRVRAPGPGQKLIEQIEWDAVELDERDYVLRAFPTSILPATPYGRLQTVKELVADGFIPREHGLALLDMPDLEGAESLQLAAYRDVQRIIAKILQRGEYEPPEPYTDLTLGIQMAQSAFLRARNDNAPGERLDLIQRWIDDAAQLVAMAAPQAQQQPGAPAATGAGADQGASMLPPQAPGMPPQGAAAPLPQAPATPPTS